MTGLLLFLLLLVMPLLELYVVIEVWQQIGGVETLFLLVFISLAGAWLVRREGLSVWQRFNRQLAAGELPTDELIDGALILFAGALMLTPGFITDGVGLLLLFPPSRAAIRALIRRRLTSRLEVYAASGRGVRFVTFGAGPAAGGYRMYRQGDVIDVADPSGAPTGSSPGPDQPPDRPELGQG